VVRGQGEPVEGEDRVGEQGCQSEGMGEKGRGLPPPSSRQQRVCSHACGQASCLLGVCGAGVDGGSIMMVVCGRWVGAV